jgi:hypothetical protein
MRIIAALVLSCLVPAAALADNAVTSVDDEPLSQMAASREPTRVAAAERAAPATRGQPVDHRAPADVGELRSARYTGPGAVAVSAPIGSSHEHDVAIAPSTEAAAPDPDVVAELAAHQMKRHERALASCTLAAHKRNPALSGSVTLDFDVADRKVRGVALTDDSVHDAALAACLTSAARGFRFSLAAARFRWPLAVR